MWWPTWNRHQKLASRWSTCNDYFFRGSFKSIQCLVRIFANRQTKNMHKHSELHNRSLNKKAQTSCKYKENCSLLFTVTNYYNMNNRFVFLLRWTSPRQPELIADGHLIISSFSRFGTVYTHLLFKPPPHNCGYIYFTSVWKKNLNQRKKANPAPQNRFVYLSVTI